MDIFVTGTDTDVGKTVITAGLAAVMQSLGYEISVYKPFQSGAIEGNKQLISPDLSFVKQIDNNIKTKYSYIMKAPTTPSVAAELEGIVIDKKKVSPVMLEKSDFSDKYQVFSDNQIEARYLLTTAMMERIEGLSFAFKAKSVRGSFMNNKLTLAINTGRDMFSMGGDFKESDSNVFMQLYDEIISVLQIVDELKLDEHTGL